MTQTGVTKMEYEIDGRPATAAEVQIMMSVRTKVLTLLINHLGDYQQLAESGQHAELAKRVSSDAADMESLLRVAETSHSLH
jgi:hypothetical protein